jgi:hypothetical protein
MEKAQLRSALDLPVYWHFDPDHAFVSLDLNPLPFAEIWAVLKAAEVAKAVHGLSVVLLCSYMR